MQNASFLTKMIIGIPVLAMGCTLVPLAFYSLLTPAVILVTIPYLVAGIFCLYVAYLIFTSAPLHAATIAYITILGTAFVIGLSVLAYGFINDMLGTRCTGFFGVSTDCLSNAWLIVMVFTLIFPVTPIFIGLSAVIAWIVQYRYLVKYPKRSTPTQ